jgi:hypothetical protein
MNEGNNGYNSMNGTYGPTTCDNNQVKVAAQYPIRPVADSGDGDLGNGGSTGYGGDTASCEPVYEWQEWSVCVTYAGGTDCDYGWDFIQTGFDCVY